VMRRCLVFMRCSHILLAAVRRQIAHELACTYQEEFRS